MTDDIQPESGPEPDTIYRLLVVASGSGYAGSMTVEAESLDDLKPTFEEINGVTYERYTDTETNTYIEIRFDYIFKREVFIVTRPEAESEHAQADKLTREHMSIPSEPPRDMAGARVAITRGGTHGRDRD